MLIKDVVGDYHVRIHELQRSIYSSSMYGALLYEGNANLITNKALLDSKVFRFFEYPILNKTIIIVE